MTAVRRPDGKQLGAIISPQVQRQLSGTVPIFFFI